MPFLGALRGVFPVSGSRPCEACKKWCAQITGDLLGRFQEIEGENSRLVDELTVLKSTISKTENDSAVNKALRSAENTIRQKSDTIRKLSAENASLRLEYAKNSQLITTLTADLSAAEVKADSMKARAQNFESQYEHKRQEIRSLTIEKNDAWRAESAAVAEKDAAVKEKNRALRLREKAEGECKEALQARDQQRNELYEVQEKVEELGDRIHRLQSTRMALDEATPTSFCCGSSAKTPVKTAEGCDRTKTCDAISNLPPTPSLSPATKESRSPTTKGSNTDKRGEAISTPMISAQILHQGASKKFGPQRYPALDSTLGKPQVSKEPQPIHWSSSSMEILASLPSDTHTIRGQTVNKYVDGRKHHRVAASIPPMPNLLNTSKEAITISGGNYLDGAARTTCLKSPPPSEPQRTGKITHKPTAHEVDIMKTVATKVYPASLGKKGTPKSTIEPPSVLANAVATGKTFTFSATPSASPKVQATGKKPSTTAASNKFTSTSGKMLLTTAAPKHEILRKKQSAAALSSTSNAKPGTSSSLARSSRDQDPPSKSSATLPWTSPASLQSPSPPSAASLGGRTPDKTSDIATSSTIPPSFPQTIPEAPLPSTAPIAQEKPQPSDLVSKGGEFDAKISVPGPSTALPDSPISGEDSRPAASSPDAALSQANTSAIPRNIIVHASTTPFIDTPALPPTPFPRVPEVNGPHTTDPPHSTTASSPIIPLLPSEAAPLHHVEHKTSTDEAMVVDSDGEPQIIPESDMDVESTEMTDSSGEPSEAPPALFPPAETVKQIEDAVMDDTEVSSSGPNTDSVVPAALGSEPADTAMKDAQEAFSDFSLIPASSNISSQQFEHDNMAVDTNTSADLGPAPAIPPPVTDEAMEVDDAPAMLDSGSILPEPTTTDNTAPEAVQANAFVAPFPRTSMESAYTVVTGSAVNTTLPVTTPTEPLDLGSQKSPHPFGAQANLAQESPDNRYQPPTPPSVLKTGDAKQGVSLETQRMLHQLVPLPGAGGPSGPVKKSFGPIYVPRVSDLKDPNWNPSGLPFTPPASVSNSIPGLNPSPVPASYNPVSALANMTTPTPWAPAGTASTDSGPAALDTTGLSHYARVHSSFYGGNNELDDSEKPEFAESKGKDSTKEEIAGRRVLPLPSRKPTTRGIKQPPSSVQVPSNPPATPTPAPAPVSPSTPLVAPGSTPSQATEPSSSTASGSSSTQSGLAEQAQTSAPKKLHPLSAMAKRFEDKYRQKTETQRAEEKKKREEEEEKRREEEAEESEEE